MTLSVELQAAVFRTFTSSVEEYITCIDEQRRVIYLNRTVSREPELILGHRVEEFIAEGARSSVVAAAAAAFESKQPQWVEYEALLADGHVRNARTKIVPFDGPSSQRFALLLTEDRTEELERQKKEDFQTRVIKNLPDFVVLADRERRFRWVNRTAPGLELSQVLGRPVDEFITEESLPAARAAIQSVFEGAAAAQYCVEGYGDGTELAWYLTRVIPIRNGSATENVLLITSDVTQQKRAELALRASEERFRALAEQSPDFIIIIGRSRAIEYLNRPTPGAALEDFLGARIDRFIHPEDFEAAVSVIESVFESGATGEFETHTSLNEYLYRVRAVPFERGERIQRLLLVATDITKERADELARESLKAQLHQAQRLESVGLLAGGIAHDFNNLLQIIQTNLYFAQQDSVVRGASGEELEQALRATERAAELTAHLLAIGRRKRVDPKTIDLRDLAGQSVRMLRRIIPENIRVDYLRSSLPCFVSADPPQIEQVLINLCVNARDAMPNGGTLSIAVRPDVSAPNQVLLQVSDTGSGISEEHRSRLFEPFFTTKGTGSGLGLAVAAGIIGAHGGAITAESELGNGASFTVRLPMAFPPEQAPRARVRERHHGHELILIAEDEPLVRRQLARVLSQAGYRILEAKDGAEAVELFRERIDDVDLVLLDIMMPSLDGWQAFSRMERMRSNVKVLFTTGYGETALPADFGQREKRMLTKPYTPEALLESVRDALDAPRAAGH